LLNPCILSDASYSALLRLTQMSVSWNRYGRDSDDDEQSTLDEPVDAQFYLIVSIGW
jgi:hypothetical protein